MSIVRYKRGSRVKLWQEIYSVVIRASYFQLLDTSTTVASWQRTIELWDNGTDGGRWIQGFEWMYENLSNQWVRLAIVYVPSGTKTNAYVKPPEATGVSEPAAQNVKSKYLTFLVP